MADESAPAGWYPDEASGGERYWDGAAWTDQLRPNGGSETSPVGTADANDSSADEPGVLWSGERRDLTAAASRGRIATARYKITEDRLILEAGLLSSSEEYVPMWAVRDLDLKQSVAQRARGVGDVRVRLEHNDYTGKPEVVLESITDPKMVRDMIDRLAHSARDAHLSRMQTQTVHHVGGQAPSQEVPQDHAEAMPNLIADELVKLAQLRDQGILTDEEFAAQKARLLG